MTDRRVHGVSLHVPDDLVAGAYANAFRILQDEGSDLFLDFCSYSERDKKGVVVARVRVHVSFIEHIRDRLSSTLKELADDTLPPTETFLVKGPGEGALN
jgi:hypothetical protein